MPFPRGVADNDHLKVMDHALAMACERLALLRLIRQAVRG
jgi:hypothetical protein